MGLAALWRTLTRRLFRRPPIPAPEPAPSRLEFERTRRNTGYLDPRSFAAELTRLTEINDGRRPRLHVVSLSDFRLTVGDKWERLSGLMSIAVDAIIRRNLDLDHDLFTRLDAETACLALPNATRQEARARVSAIASDISTQLFGTALVGGRRPQVLATNLGLDGALDGAGGLDPLAIATAVTDAGSALAAAEPLDSATTRATLADLMGDLPAAPAAPDEPEWQTQRRDARPAAEIVLVAAERRRADLDAPATVPDWLDHQIEERGRQTVNSAAHFGPDSSLTLVWSPTWVTSSRSIGAFHARVIRQDNPASPPLEGVNAYAGVTPVEALMLDRFVATQAARELTDLSLSRQRIGLTVPLHWMSLAPRWRDCIRLPFESCPPAARRSLLKIEVFGLTPQMPEAILSRLFEPLERLGCDVMARLPLSESGMADGLRSVRAIGVDLAELSEDDRVGDDELFERLEAMRTAARRSRTASYVWGVRRRPLIARVIRAGFSLINGPGVMTDLARPMPPSSIRPPARR